METPTNGGAEMPAPIKYEKRTIDGIDVRPDTRQVLLKAVEENRPIEVGSSNDYINLYHVFERMQQVEKKKYGGYLIVRKQIGPDRWLMFLTKSKEKVPAVELLDGYDPKRGRYKRMALDLANGNAITLAEKAEAIKARRAWQLYVPAENRRHLRSTIKKVPKTGKFMVMILERAG